MKPYKGLECAMPKCNRQALFAMTWRPNKKKKVRGLVCSWHDQHLGKMNLRKAGLPEVEVQAINREMVRGESAGDRRKKLHIYE